MVKCKIKTEFTLVGVHLDDLLHVNHMCTFLSIVVFWLVKDKGDGAVRVAGIFCL